MIFYCMMLLCKDNLGDVVLLRDILLENISLMQKDMRNAVAEQASEKAGKELEC